MDWQVGARGPHYTNAAANTELVGRQLGMLLELMVDKGMHPKNMHLIGFSLGAHVCGSASEALKARGYLIGRITGNNLFIHFRFAKIVMNQTAVYHVLAV